MAERSSTEIQRLRKIGWREWDPLGLFGSGCPEDEYDEYLLRAASLIGNGASVEDVAGYLDRVVAVDMLVAQSRSDSLSVARSIRHCLEKSDETVSVFVFRTAAINGMDTEVCAASADVVKWVFGGGGVHGAAGLEAAFGGCAYFRNDDTGAAFLGVWRVRNGGRFRRAIREAGIVVTIVRKPPPARLSWTSKPGKQ